MSSLSEQICLVSSVRNIQMGFPGAQCLVSSMFYQFLPLDLEVKLISKPHWCLISQNEGGKTWKNNAIFAWWCNFHVWIVCGRWGLPLCSCELQDVLLGRGMWRDKGTWGPDRTSLTVLEGASDSHHDTYAWETNNVFERSQTVKKVNLTTSVFPFNPGLSSSKVCWGILRKDPKKFPGNY